jgi:hypothetical protein
MNTITLRPAEPERDFEQIAAWFALREDNPPPHESAMLRSTISSAALSSRFARPAGKSPQLWGKFSRPAGGSPQLWGRSPRSWGTFPRSWGTFPRPWGTFPQPWGKFPRPWGKFPRPGEWGYFSNAFTPDCPPRLPHAAT